MARLFELDHRLQCCADMVSCDENLVDVGTDHAYLPIWLVKTGKIKNAIAADINPLPLQKALNNIVKYKTQNEIKITLSDGLNNISEKDASTIVIAGMGADSIVSIIKSCPWVKNNKTLILQPMTSPEKLRRFLKDNLFTIILEKAILSSGKSYSVMKVCYGYDEFSENVLYPYIGKICQNDDIYYNDFSAVTIYIKKEIKNLNNRLKGFITKNNFEEIDNIKNIILKLEEVLKNYYD